MTRRLYKHPRKLLQLLVPSKQSVAAKQLLVSFLSIAVDYNTLTKITFKRLELGSSFTWAVQSHHIPPDEILKELESVIYLLNYLELTDLDSEDSTPSCQPPILLLFLFVGYVVDRVKLFTYDTQLYPTVFCEPISRIVTNAAVYADMIECGFM
jgi:hypothetical protein